MSETQKLDLGNQTILESLSQKCGALPEKCPVLIFEKYIAQRPTEMCNPDSPFYLSINYKPGDGAHWYKKQKMGKDRIGQIMKRISTQGSLQGRKTNHSARKTMITKLAHCDVPDSRIMQFVGSPGDPQFPGTLALGTSQSRCHQNSQSERSPQLALSRRIDILSFSLIEH